VKLAPVVDAELAHRVVDVCLYGSSREYKAIRYFCVRQSASGELDHLRLPRREFDRGVVDAFDLWRPSALSCGQ
jgi:hypothetical protein